MNEPIFVLANDGTLQKVMRADYDSEQWLQDLLATYPDLLAGEQIAPDEPLRWMVVGREVGIPDGVDTADRWALDLLLIDSCGRPTLVEIKRSSDSRIRREVVGQMLDYAANAQLYWPLDRLRALATERHGGSDNLDAEIARLLNAAADLTAEAIESFWTSVGDNLRQGRVRLLFVADALPRELRRIIAFLNDRMPEVDVLGVEIPQYTGSSFRALVPRLIGHSELTPHRQQPASPRSTTNQDMFCAALQPAVGDFFRQLIATAAEQNAVSVEWAQKNGIIRIRPASARRPMAVLYLNPPGSYGDSDPALEFYLRSIGALGLADSLRHLLEQTGALKPHGQFTLRLPVSEAALPVARQVSATFWNWCRAVSGGEGWGGQP